MQPLLLTLAAAAADAEGGLSAIFDVGQSSMIWTILIFVLSVPLMWKVVFGPISKALDARETEAREAASAAEQAREEVAAMQEKIEADLAEARREAAQRVDEAKARAEAREKEILAAARDEAERERTRSREEIDRALQSARETLRREAVELGIGVAERAISREFGADDQKRLVDDFYREVSAN